MSGRDVRIVVLLGLISSAGFASGYELRHGNAMRALLVLLATAAACLIGGALVQTPKA